MRVYLDPTATEGGAATPPAPAPTPAPDLNKLFKDALKSHDSDAAKLAREIFEDRARLQADLEATKAKLPTEAQRVISADDHALYQMYRAMGTPADIDERIKELADHKTKLAALEHERACVKACESLGWDPKVFSALKGVDQLAITWKQVLNRAGKHDDVPHVKDGETDVPLKDWAEKQWPHLMDALARTNARDAGSVPRRTTQPGPVKDPVPKPTRLGISI